MKEDLEPEDLLDLWFESDAWATIQHNASEYNCPDSTELMEQINDQLGSIIFHLKNESGADRMYYELLFFQNLINEFDILNE